MSLWAPLLTLVWTAYKHTGYIMDSISARDGMPICHFYSKRVTSLHVRPPPVGEHVALWLGELERIQVRTHVGSCR